MTRTGGARPPAELEGAGSGGARARPKMARARWATCSPGPFPDRRVPGAVDHKHRELETAHGRSAAEYA
eukprot:7184323-Lingulodinium_polyedra.AAC.1